MEILGGPLFSVAGAGESHGPAITTIIYGCPPDCTSGPSIFNDISTGGVLAATVTAHRGAQDDTVVLLSGLYQPDHETLTAGPQITVQDADGHSATTGYGEGFTTGEPIAAIVLSTAKKSADYSQFAGPAGEVRPGHTDLVKFKKSQGFVDPRGGGRSSYRSTITDVIGGSIARMFLAERFGTVILSSICQVGQLRATTGLAAQVEEMARSSDGTLTTSVLAELEARMESAEIHSVDGPFAEEAGQLIKATRIDGDSLGAAVEVVAINPPALAGDPLYQSLKLRLMGVLGGMHAVQGVEIGSGFAVVERRGSENNDPIRAGGYQSNSHGGLIGGITTGMPLAFRIGFKPTSTIAKPQQSVRKDLTEIEFRLQKGRHDPCVGVRAGVTLESRVAIELMNAVLMHASTHVAPADFDLFR